MSEHKFLLFYFLAYFAAAFAWWSWKNWKVTGINPIVLPKSDDAYGYVASGFKLSMLALLVYLVALNVYPQTVVKNMGVLLLFESDGLFVAGWILLCVALLMTLKAQSDMGLSWRIGIDSERQTELISTGIFAYSRNPIFLSMRLGMLGLFLVLPNAVSLSILIAAEILMQVQVRLEETHLQQLHPSLYPEYRQRVRRWL